MSYLIPCMILFPVIVALILSGIKNGKVRGIVVYSAVTIIIGMALTMLGLFIRKGDTIYLYFQSDILEMINMGMLGIEVLLMFLIVYLSCKHNKFIISLLSIAQTGIVFWVEIYGPESEWAINKMTVDRLSVLMCLIVAVIGGLICVYAVGYMHGFHQHHKEFEDRRPFFFFILFVFLGAMFGLVLSNSLLWLDFFWEITSISSFLLIGYTKTKEAVDNSFRALWMNLLGGLAIAIAILYLIVKFHITSLGQIIAPIQMEKVGMIFVMNKVKLTSANLIIPIALLAFAALTKSAQMPFSKWLLGAMVAPTPSSALLHSATMVKAGVYLLLRLGPAMSGTKVGTMVAFIGGFSFLSASMLAISQSDAKKVLAYSTISNLGLITACAGAGRVETIWAGVFLLIFHAISKSMLFQDVGAVENATGSRNIEDMDSLIIKLPRLAGIMMIGIAGMFLAPFGMLISKWAALKAFVDINNVILVIFIAFGSATTMFYWMKWFGKLLGISNVEKVRDITKKNEIVSLFIHAFLMIALCLSFPFLSKEVVEPMLYQDIFIQVTSTSTVLENGNFYVMVVMLVAVFVFPAVTFLISRKVRQEKVISYMGGANEGDNRNFTNSYGGRTKLYMTNWYMENIFGEKKLLNPSLLLAAVVLIVMMCVIIGGGII